MPPIEPSNDRPFASGAWCLKVTASPPTPIPSGPTATVQSVLDAALTSTSPPPRTAVSWNSDSARSGSCGGSVAPYVEAMPEAVSA